MATVESLPVARKPKRPKVLSKWGKRGIRIDASLRIDDARWIQTTKGWRHVTDQVSEDEWVLRRRHRPEWRQGAARLGARVTLERAPRTRPERTGSPDPRDFFGGPASCRTHGGMPLVKPARELKSWAKPVTVRGKPGIDMGIRMATTKNTYARVMWRDHAESWVNLHNLREAAPERRHGLVVQ